MHLHGCGTCLDTVSVKTVFLLATIDTLKISIWFHIPVLFILWNETNSRLQGYL